MKPLIIFTVYNDEQTIRNAVCRSLEGLLVRMISMPLWEEEERTESARGMQRSEWNI